MSEIVLPAEPGSKSETYGALIPQIRALVADEPDGLANLANTVAALYHGLAHASWVGFYRVRGDELVLGPFQGLPACIRIARGRGVCGTAWATGELVLVPDVDAFPGHIACDSASKSEIVVPVRDGGRVIGVLDVDSTSLAAFDEVDARELCVIAGLLARSLSTISG